MPKSMYKSNKPKANKNNKSKQNKNKKKMDAYNSRYKARTRMEEEGSRMIYEDNEKIANLPQESFIKKYPYVGYNEYYLNDTISKIDYQMYEDKYGTAERKSGEFPEKY